MDWFNLFKKPSIDQGVQEYEAESEAILLDVRTSQEYQEGHIPESKNVPLQFLDEIETVVNKKDTPIFFIVILAVEVIRRQAYFKRWDISM